MSDSRAEHQQTERWSKVGEEASLSHMGSRQERKTERKPHLPTDLPEDKQQHTKVKARAHTCQGTTRVAAARESRRPNRVTEGVLPAPRAASEAGYPKGDIQTNAHRVTIKRTLAFPVTGEMIKELNHLIASSPGNVTTRPFLEGSSVVSIKRRKKKKTALC